MLTVLFVALLTVLLVGMPLVFLMGRSRSTQYQANQQQAAGAQNAPPPVVQHPPAGAHAHAGPAPDAGAHHAPATHEHGAMHWVKEHMWIIIPWTLALVGLLGLGGLSLYSFTDVAWSPIMLIWAGVGFAVTILMVRGTIDHFAAHGKGARYAVTIVAALAFILCLGSLGFYFGTELIHGADAQSVRAGWIRILAEATKPGHNSVKIPTWEFTENLTSYTLLLIGIAIVLTLALWPEKKEEKKDGGHH